MNKSVVPNFFIAGMPRCGTSSMVTYLKQHPDVYLSPFKEPHFFSKDLNMPTNYIWREELYSSLFDGVKHETAVGEASVWYLSSRLAAGMIRQFNPQARIIIMLRDPVRQMESLHGLWVRSGNEPVMDFIEALELEERRTRGLDISPATYFPYGLFYREVAAYYQKVKRFFDLFPRRQIHIILFHDFIQRMEEVMRGILEFLQVDAAFQPEFDIEKANLKIRKQALLQLRHVHPEIRRMLKEGMRKLRPPLQRPPLPKQVEQELRHCLREDIHCLQELIARDLSAWKGGET
jgi:hypothetical protein